MQLIFIAGVSFSFLLSAGLICFFVLSYFMACHFHLIEPFDSALFDIVNITSGCVIAIILNYLTSYFYIKNLVFAHSLEEERNLYLAESVHDKLTGLNNRRSFDLSVDFFTSVCRHVHQTVCVVMMDVDFFKKYNDYYGHQAGDAVLQAVGTVLNRLVEEDRVFAARVGGEEFIVLWSENRLIEAERVVLKLRKMIHDLKIPHEMSTVAPIVTASFGLYIMRGGAEDSADELYKAADEALYHAKEWGRDCIVLHDSADRTFKKVEYDSPDDLPRRGAAPYPD
jgi:diguanylate cyclase (GGDEF)-like protein